MVLAVVFAWPVPWASPNPAAKQPTKPSVQGCHGAAGTPSAGMAKMMGVKPASDPAIKALTVDQIIATVKNGKGKMKPIAGLTDAQIKDVVDVLQGPEVASTIGARVETSSARSETARGATLNAGESGPISIGDRSGCRRRRRVR